MIVSNANYGTKDELSAYLANFRAEDEVKDALARAEWDPKVGSSCCISYASSFQSNRTHAKNSLNLHFTYL